MHSSGAGVGPLPAPSGRKVPAVPWSEVAGVQVMGVSTGHPTPADERDRSRAVLSRLVRGLQAVVPADLPAMGDRADLLDEVWNTVHRDVFGEPPALPSELSHGPDLGALMQRGPFVGYLERTQVGSYVLDLSVFATYTHRPAARSLAVLATFSAQSGRLRCDTITELETATVHTPDSANWSLACRLVACALLTHTLIVRHVGGCHLFVSGPTAVCVRNHLRPDHPVALLLWPHVHGALEANNRVVPSVLDARPGPGLFADVFNLEGRAVWHLLSDEAAVFDLRRLDPVYDRCARGMQDAPIDTPTLDDAEALWTVLSRYTSGWVHHHYPSERALLQDSELVAFVDRLGEAVPGGVGSVAGRPVTRAGLSRLCALLLYNASVQHELVGNLLWDYAPWAMHVPSWMGRDGSGPGLGVYQRFMRSLGGMCVPSRRLMSDWTFLAPDMRSRSLVYALQADLARRQATMETEGPRASHRLYPADLEAVVGV